MAPVYVITLAGLAMPGWVLAYWASLWFEVTQPAPDARGPAQAVEPASINTAAASDLFGTAQREQPINAINAIETIDIIAIKLLGVAATPDRRQGHAIMQLNGKEILAVLEGKDIAPGVRLYEVHADHIVLERDGMRENLSWPTAISSMETATLPEQGSSVDSFLTQIHE